MVDSMFMLYCYVIVGSKLWVEKGFIDHACHNPCDIILIFVGGRIEGWEEIDCSLLLFLPFLLEKCEGVLGLDVENYFVQRPFGRWRNFIQTIIWSYFCSITLFLLFRTNLAVWNLVRSFTLATFTALSLLYFE